MTAIPSSDLHLWRAFRGACERVSAAIEREMVAATRLSAADHGILSRISAGGGSVRQQDLADNMRWDRTRMSHHLTRMEARDLVRRSKSADEGTFVAITEEGEVARALADPVHAEALRRHFLSKLTLAQREAIASLASSLAELERGDRVPLSATGKDTGDTGG